MDKLSIKLVAFISLILIFIFIVIFSVFIFISIKSTLTRSLIDQGKTEIASLVRIQANNHLSPEIFSEPNLKTTQKTFDQFFKEINTHNVLKIKVWDTNAKIIASNDPTIVGLRFWDNQTFQKAIKGQIAVEIKAPLKAENIKEKGYRQLMEVYVPIVYANKKIVGVIEAYVILDGLNRQILYTQKEILSNLSIISALVLIVISGIFILQYKGFLIKINKLIKYTSQIGVGNFDVKVNYIKDDELSKIFLALNKMSNELKESLISKGELENQIKNRTQEIQSKIDELEKTNKLMVNREVKMIELKNENVKLKKMLK